MVTYQYMVSNNKIAQIFDKIKTAAQPSKFTSEFLKNIGFTSSNDRAFINVLKNLEFLSADDTEIRGAISRVTGKEEDDVKRMSATFKALCNYADFNETNEDNTMPNIEEPEPMNTIFSTPNNNELPEFHYNIQIHLPATTDISVYNAIFKSIKDNLFK